MQMMMVGVCLNGEIIHLTCQLKLYILEQYANQLAGVVNVSYSNVQGGWTGTGNIDADPLFVSGPTGNSTSVKSLPVKGLTARAWMPVVTSLRISALNPWMGSFA